MAYRVELVDEPTRTVARKRAHVSGETVGEEIATGIGELFAFAEHRRVEPTGPPIVAFDGEPGPGREFDVEIYLPIADRVEAEPPLDVVELVGGPHALLLYRGRYEDMGAAYEAIGAWSAEEGYEADGPPREVYLTAPSDVVYPSHHVTEIYVPVREASSSRSA